MHYLLVVDYFSRFLEIAKLTSTTAAAVSSSLKSIFARHGIPEVVHGDNGQQYVSNKLLTFAELCAPLYGTPSATGRRREQ